MLLALVGSTMLLSVAPAPTFWRLASSALPGIILLGWFLDSGGRLARTLKTALALGLALLAPYGVARFQSITRTTLITPQGQLAVAGREVDPRYAWVRQHVRPGEYFYEPYSMDMDIYLNLRNPTPLFLLTDNAYTTSEQVGEVIEGLDQHRPRYIFWPLRDSEPFPAWEAADEDHLGPLRDYVRLHYRVVKAFSEDEAAWERTD